MIAYSHPALDTKELIAAQEWIDSFLGNSYAQIKGLDATSLEYERKKDLLDRLSLLWSETKIMSTSLEQYRAMTKDLLAAQDFESVQQILKANIYEQ